MLPSANGPQPVKALLLDASPAKALYTLDQLQRAERTVFETRHFGTLDEALQGLNQASYDVFLVEIADVMGEAVTAIRAFRRICPAVPIFVIADSEDPLLALEILSEGAEDCLVTRFINPRAVERAVLYGIERKRGQCALQERDLRYRVLFNQIDLGIALFEVVFDENGRPADHRFLEVNLAFEKYMRQESGRVLGRTLRDAFPGNEGFWTKACDQAAASAEPVHFETYEPGFEKWFEVTAFRLTPNQVALTFADVSGRKRAEQDLLFKTALLEAQSETTIDGILVVDESERVVLANRRFAEVFAIPDDLLSLRDDRLLLQYVTGQIEDAGAFLDRVKYLTGHWQERSRDEIGLKDGRTLDRYSAPLTDANGTYRGRIWYFRDITDRKRGEEDLYRSQQMLRSVLDNIPQRVFWKDKNSLFLGCNQAFASDAGLSGPAEIVGKSDFELPWSEIAASHRADDKLVMEQGIAKLHFDESRTKTDGSFSWVRANKLPLRDREGNVTGVIATYEDITERKRLEVDLQQAQKLEAVGHLAAGIAHEINTPIQFVGDNTRFMRDAFGELEKLLHSYEQVEEAAAGKVDGQLLRDLADAKEQSDWEYLKSEIPKALDQTLDGVDRVARIVRAMKEFSHVDRSGKKAAADLNRALESTLVVARNELKYIADVVTEFGEIPPVVCNLGDLNQVFLNLLVNAAHAIEDVVRGTGAKGTIRLKTWQEGEQVVVSIGDTGTGIPQEIRQKVFEPFFTTKEVGRGSGQGLALARGVVVERHSGSLTFETEIGKGTTFFVRLPLNSAEILKQEDQRLAASALCG